MLTAERRIRQWVITASAMDKALVKMSPYLAEQDEDLFLVVDVPRMEPGNKHDAMSGPKNPGTTWTHWMGDVTVNAIGEGGAAVLRRLVLFGLSDTLAESKLGLTITFPNAIVTTGEHVRGDAVLPMAGVAFKAEWHEVQTMDVGGFESAGITLDHEETRVTREVVDVDAGTPAPA